MERTTTADPGLRTDVLVLGAGAAGLRAALEAARAGARVTVVSKLGPDEPTCTVTAWGGLTYCPDDRREDLFRQVVETGGYLNDQRLVEVFVRETPERLRELAALGVSLDVLDGADAQRRLGLVKIPGRGRTTGLGLTRPLRAAAEAAGVRFLDRVMVTRLVTGDQGTVGALAVRLADRAVLPLGARAVVAATGGGACLYGRTDNPPGATGDGIALAYEAGAELVDLECVSFVVPEARLPDLLGVREPPDEALLEIGAAHYFLGGVRIGPDCRTTVPGLFGAGEVTGGLFGAARLGGTALAETIVFGAIAGREAGRYARSREAAPIDPALVREEARRVEALCGGRDLTPAQFAADMGRVLWRFAGTMKSGRTLRQAAEALGRLAPVPALRVDSPAALRQALECPGMLTTARLIVAASLLREETRGCFWRVDFPRYDNERWVRNIVLWRTAGGPAHAVRPPAMTRLTRPTAPRVGAGCFSYLPEDGARAETPGGPRAP